MLKRIAENVWAHEKDIRMGPGMNMPGRATILRLDDGRLIVHSPLAIDDATAKEIDALGDVRFLVAPNCMHWMFVKAAKERYAKARVFAAPGLAKKLGSFPSEPLPVSGELDGACGVRVESVQGAPSMEEHVLFHEPSRSLLVTDLIFNLHECRSFGMRLFLRLGGCWKRTAQSKMWRFLVKDRAAAAQSAQTILGLDFERIVVAHGNVIEDDAREQARRALEWMTRGTPKLLGAGSAVA
jgi:Domain of unknown function (DUF4336)